MFSVPRFPRAGRVRLPLIRLACLGLLLSSRSAIAAGNGQETALPPGAQAIEVLFDETPVEEGIVFDRRNVKPTSIELNGKKQTAWVAERSIEASAGWIRSFRLKISDPRFQNGGRPAVDLEITYHHPAAASLRVKADTSRGPVLVASRYGSTKDWTTLRVSLDDAFFGAREDTTDERAKLSGFDLRIDGANGPLYLRKVRLIGYNTEQQVLWGRMLKTDSIQAQRPGGVLAFLQAPKQQLQAVLRNIARISRPIYYRFRVAGYDDKVRFRADGDLSLPGSGTQLLGIEFDSSTWPLGPYDATLELFSDRSTPQPLFSRTMRMGVVSKTELEKARPGEFLYGLDPSNYQIYSSHTPAAFAYYRLMGVDILRNLFDKGMPQTAESVRQALASLSKEDLQSMIVIDPPKEQDPAKRAAELPRKEAFLEEIARSHAGRGPGKLHFFEMGNEPDLPYFYPGSIADYLASYYAMYDAVKRGAKEKGDTVVMNGGLSFAGAEGSKRSREFIELLDLGRTDAIAYHGHGPGIEAERSAYERLDEVVRRFGKTGKPFVETESGFSGGERRGLEEQARTVVEKLAYAQSKQMPTFMYFRLFMEGGHDGGYGMTENLTEPRPSVLSYRTMVEQLRHHRFVKSLDFAGKAGATGANGFLFEEIGADAEPTGRKVLVSFCERPIEYDLLLRLSAPGEKVEEARLIDLYGNSRSAALLSGNIASLPVGVAPAYLAWRSAGAASDVQPEAPPISVETVEPLLANASTKISLSVHNPEHQAVDAELSLEAKARLPIEASPAQQKLALPATEPAKATIELRLGKADQPLRLPHWWKVFLDVDPVRLSGQDLASIPLSLPGKSAQITGNFVWADQNQIDFAKLAGGPSERRPAFACAYLDSPTDIDLPCAANADWWMAWYLNGERVYDTLETGNQHRSLASQPITLRLKKGRNILSVVVLSGKHGWKLEFAGPKERELAVNAGQDPDRLLITLSSAGRTLARQTVPLQLQGPVPPLGNIGAVDDPANWMPLEPLAALEGDSVTNFWMNEPQQSRWYGGMEDLSAMAWLREDGKNLHLFVSVADSKLVQAPAAEQLSQYDSLRVVLTNEDGGPLLDLTGGLVAGMPRTMVAVRGTSFNVVQGETATSYRLSIPKSIVGGKPFRLSFTVADNDSGFLKQVLEFGRPAEHGQGKRMVLE